ncbi:MAG: GNAT family N-acetyltransferase [Aeromicrobium sp.]
MSIAFRPMALTDLANLVRWMAADHAQPWFEGEPRTVEDAEKRFGSYVDRSDRSIRMWVVALDGRDIGYIQDYRVDHDDDYAVRVQDPTAAAFDYLIGEPDLIDQGIGTEMIRQFCSEILVNLYPDSPRFLATPDARNARSIRTLEKLGFTQGLWITHNDAPNPEIVCTAGRELFEF